MKRGSSFSPRRLAPWALLALILLLAAGLRWYGLAWDAGYLFHPDERQIVMVASNLSLPGSAAELFSPASPLNPHFFAYGSFPIYLLRALAPLAPKGAVTGPWADDQLAGWVILGRAVSGLFDLGTILLVFALGRRLYGLRVGLAAAACSAFTVLEIQLAHFYAVDTLLACLCMATLYAALVFADTRLRRWLFLTGVFFGLALATKVTAALLIVPIAYACYRAYRGGLAPRASHSPDAGEADSQVPSVIASEARQSRKHVTSEIASARKAGLAITSGPYQETMQSPSDIGEGQGGGEGGDLGKRGDGSVPRRFTKDVYLGARAGWAVIRRPLLKICCVALAVFLVTQPYALIDWYSFGRDVIRELFVARGWMDVPYTRQYANTLPFIYQVWQSAVWGMGPPLGVVAWAGAALCVVRTARTREWPDTFLVSWALVYFLSVGGQFVKYPRYLLPLLPVLHVLAGRMLLSIRVRRLLAGAVLAFVLACSLVYSLAFVSMYSQEHPWLSISRWIYENTPAGASIAVEQWDDYLPVRIDVGPTTRTGSEYHWVPMPIYDPDSPSKMEQFASILARADTVVLASQRGYGSVGREPDRYPLTARYYQNLFDGALGFQLAASASNGPRLLGVVLQDNPRSGLAFAGLDPPDPGGETAWNWGFEDESLAVYDHPQPLVFVKRESLSEDQLYRLLTR